MPIDMLDRLQENKLRGLEELIDPWEADAVPASGEDQAAAVGTEKFIRMLGIFRLCFLLGNQHAIAMG